MNIGTIGTGFIVDRFMSAVLDIDGMECIAMFSRKEASARPLADKFQVGSIYTDLKDFLSDSEIDVVYVASPNSLHALHTQEALEYGKHVICEKPFTSTAKEAAELRELAKEKGLMLFEAITTIHLPNYQVVKDLLPKIGEIKLVQCNYSQYSSRYDKLLAGETPNVFNPAFSGGALADINIYNLHFVMNLFGSPDSVKYIANQHANGIDTSGVLVMTYPGKVVHCTGAKDTDSLNYALIQGEKGYLHVESSTNVCEAVILHEKGKESVRFNDQNISNRMHYELMAFKTLLTEENYDTCYRLLDYSCEVMKVYESARKTAGTRFPADDGKSMS
ncbi:Gfo/Idh/MocA family protein [Salisediminibacterium beveridgei]|uniref:NAD-dependent oxidoreductase n=1 Tax=Salisediminibacterium beveridgei TaxID=632773 RepID=A0A1D7QX74_9BACI|nr:Gfo/Idh/MocA family oxidoreductase [Salisediminibacterium beveridgei]AOM83622.1 NAD-dependent oxidoreductase [Salisediminibacterium beveridgei]